MILNKIIDIKKKNSKILKALIRFKKSGKKLEMLRITEDSKSRLQMTPLILSQK